MVMLRVRRNDLRFCREKTKMINAEFIEKLHIIIGFSIMGLGLIILIYDYFTRFYILRGYLIVIFGWLLVAIGSIIYPSDWFNKFRTKKIA